MKKHLLSGFIVAAIFSILSGSQAAPPQESYPLVCRGWARMAIGTAPGEKNIGFKFAKGTRPAREGLKRGECSWKDRGMYPDEPDRLSQHVAGSLDSLKAGGTLAPENTWYAELHSPDKYWTFMVYNNKDGQLIVTAAQSNSETHISPGFIAPDEIKPAPTPKLP